MAYKGDGRDRPTATMAIWTDNNQTIGASDLSASRVTETAVGAAPLIERRGKEGNKVGVVPERGTLVVHSIT